MTEHDEIVLAAQGVTKRFGGVKALDEAHLEVRAGQVTAVMGENGAGKSTLRGPGRGQITNVLRQAGSVFANPRQARAGWRSFTRS
jgi:ABC-type sugar transport system ATPase subunit